MLCAISGEAPQAPVASRKSGNVFEKRLIEQYIRENGTDPVNGEELTVEDLIDLKQSRVVRPRPPTHTSIPALLASFQNEWDALILETYQLKQQLAETRQELSTSLYYNDSAEKVIARLQRERDEARDALSKVTISSTNGANGHGADAMQVDSQGLPDSIIARIDQTQQQLSSTRRKRAIPETWVTAEELQSFGTASSSGSVASSPGARTLAVDTTGDLVLLGGTDGTAVVYSISQGKLVQSLESGAGAVLDGVWWGNRPVLAKSTGAIKVFENGSEVSSLTQHAGPATAITLHPCGDILASVGADKSYILYDLQTMKPIAQRNTDSELTSASFHPDGHLLAAGTASGNITLFDVKTLENVATFTSSTAGPVQALTFSENGTWLATITKGQTSVTIWDLRKMAEIKTLEVGSPVTNIAWDYTGQFLAACGPGNVVVQQYSKSTKSWSEPFRKAANARDVQWGSNAQSLVVLSTQGEIEVFSN